MLLEKDLLKQIGQIYDDLPEEKQKRILLGIKYCNECKLQVMASAIPDEILDWWTEPSSHIIFCFGCVFFFVQSYKCMTQEGYAEQSGEEHSFLVAMKLLKYVRAAREAGKSFPDYDVFDVREYDRMLKEFEK